MNNTRTMSFCDFNYKNKNLSDFGYIIGSTESDNYTISVLPSRNYITDKAIQSDRYIIFDSYLDPRTFEVKICKLDTKDGDIRELASWLNSPTPAKFYFVGDSVYINCVLDSDAFNAETICGVDNEITLKFIAYDPFYYSLNSKQYIQALTSDTVYNFENKSTADIFPTIQIDCQGDVKVTFYDNNDKQFAQFTVKDNVSGFIMNCENNTIKSLSGVDIDTNLTGDYPIITDDNFKIKVVGSNLGNLKLNYTERFV